jgi:UDP-N-acetylglucosamine 2-epimerase (non-hydrolysing)
MSHRPCIHLVAAARPNFMKIAPLVRALQREPRLAWKLIHTGQHFDQNMSGIFFDELGIPPPNANFNCGGGSHAAQTARIMEAFEIHCEAARPDAVLVVGDVNSTMACAIVAKKAGISVAHVEAGLRSGDMGMPEEINRILTDAITDWFFVTEPAGLANLQREGHAADRIFHVGNVMVDNLMYQAERLAREPAASYATQAIKQQLNGRYGVVTLHRPSNVDSVVALSGIAQALNVVADELPLVFPVHPRTRARLQELGGALSPHIHLMEPQPYMSFLNLWKDATVVLTDSGGLQEETTALGVPCITLRNNTERPITVDEGSNTLAGTDPDNIKHLALEAVRHGGKRGQRPAFWDGVAAERIVAQLVKHMC